MAVPFRKLHRTLEHQSRRPTLPDPIPVRRMLLLPTGPVLPARNRAASRRAAHRQRNCNRPPTPRRGVITNFDAQIHAFTDVISSMDAMLADLPADQRAVIDNASRELRKARTAAAFIPLESVTTHTNEDEQR